ncbi:MAG TPA: PAS domain S-box protein, partial [Sphingobacteriaceae bacterium]
MGPIKILILEHDPHDLELLVRTLKKSDLEYESSIADCEETYVSALNSFGPDIILSDFSLPTFDGLSAFHIKNELRPETPFILVSGTIGEERAVDLIKMGITDYALKEKMYVIPPKIRRALTEAQERREKLRAEKELESSRQHLQKIMDGSLDMICTIDLDGVFVNASAASVQILGYTPEELIGRQIMELVHPDDRELVRSFVENSVTHFEHRMLRKDGSDVLIFWSVRWNYEERMSYCVARDVSAIRQAEAELSEQDAQIRNILESVTDGFYSVDRNWCIQHWNKQAENLLGITRAEVLGHSLWDFFPEALSMKFYTIFRKVLEDGEMASFEEFYPPLKMWVSVDAYRSKDGLSVFFRDITEGKRQSGVINLEREVLKVYTTQGSTIEESIRMLFDGIRQIHPELICSILKRRDEKLIFWNYSQLPQVYRDALEPIDIAAGQGASGAAAKRKEKVVVTDIATDPLYERFRSVTENRDLKACTAYPLLDPYRNLLGTFSIYLESPRVLTAAESSTIERAQYILENILENFFSERRLKESEANYRVLFQKSPSLLMVFDPETLRFLNVNEAVISHYGYTREEFLERTIRDLRTPDGLVDLERALRTSIREPYFELIADHRKKNGEVIRVHVQNTAIVLDKKEVRLALITDITEKIRIERELELTQRRFRVLVQEGSDLISILDKDGNYTYVSPAYTAIFGYNTEDLNNCNAFELVHPEDRERIVKQFREVKTVRRVKTEPFRYRCANGEYCWLESIATNLLNDPSVGGIVINSRDITESLNNLKAIELQNEQLRDIAWIQSHIVRAPVARIMGLVDLLNNYRENEKIRAEMLEHIVTSANELD